MTRTNSNHPVLIDCDTGIDDALALVYLAGLVAAGEVQLRAVTTTAGNVDATQTALNSTHILRLCGLSNVPVLAGVPTPLAVPLVTTPETHGPHGLGYVIPPETSTDTIAVTPGERPDTVPVSVPAADTGWDDLWCANRDATLIITGPATNLAIYLRTHPAHQRIYLMGGAYLYPGNTTPTAEWNTWVDPHAAAEVFHATIPITVCPLGVRSQPVTESMLLSPDLLDAACDILAAAHHPLADV
ncbi:MAG: nucleoside hydrolase, partial [Corynebacterium matruchotii]